MKSRNNKTGPPPGWKVQENPLFTRLLADAHRLQGRGYVGLVSQASRLKGQPRSRVNEAQQILTSLLSGELEADKDKVKL